MQVALQVSYILIPFLWSDWLRKGTGFAWIAIVLAMPFPADPLAAPTVPAYMFIHLVVATLLNLMDAAAQKERV